MQYNNKSRAFNGPGKQLGGNRFMRGNQKPKNLRKTLKRLWGMFGKEKKLFIVVFILVFLSVNLLLLVPYLIGKAVDILSVGPNAVEFNKLLWVIGILMLIYIIDASMNLIQGLTMAGIAQRIVKNIRKIFFDKLQVLPMSYFDRSFHGDIMSRLTNDIDILSSTISSSVVQLMNSAISIVGSFVMMVILSPLLTVASLISVPLIFILTRTIASKTKVYFKGQQDTLGALNSQIEESISGLDVIKAFNHEEKIISEFEKLNEDYKNVGFKAQVWSGLLMPLMNVINNLSFATVAMVGGTLAIKGYITLGVIASFLSYSRQFVRPLNEIANIFNTLQSAVAGAERVFELLDEEEEIIDKEGAKELKEVRGEVEFKDIYFGYNDKDQVLKDINFKVRPGTSVAIVGATGSGKTTIVNLLSRFYEISKGSITIDGVDIRDYTRESLRKVFGIVLQDTYLFSGTIKDNIKYGKPDATEEEIMRASKIANAHSFIARLPKGYDTEILEGGSSLSAGQKQLLAIARAVLSDTPILILDEATSNVDTRTELKIQQAMLNLMKGRTSFIIAHRLSTIKDSDMIMVIDDGRIIECGSHEELVREQGTYYNLCTINKIC
ncbi:ATP-binding cassette, subfamily B [Clostridium collagenovorans DSM 3089]|uniref:ATP-binding cassette, subfamily B n=1 Tax=Clostridium collagenovorans DSM 3089 TaxID=1121306 RepID=A0A1M5X578_9CLOT|nr:ABC transporter ATP-binding protein [Clostridium collagenovorans]SHH94668.1 ATP-binding cassette, subfamily B [Clostridium collagenovorans DSM 3089]